MPNRQLVAIGVSLLSAACFDTQQVDVTGRVKVDDFEDGDQIASSGSGFGDWYCGTYSTGAGQQAAPTCALSAGFASTYAESVTFSLHKANDAEYPGVVLGVSPVFGTRDLSAFEHIRFKAKFEPGEATPPGGTRLLVELKCSSAQGQPDNQDPNFSIVYHGEPLEGVELPSDWSSHTHSFAAFRQNQYQTPLSDESSCATLVDSLQFRIEPGLMIDGQAAAGTLTIDDVYLE